MFENTSCLIIRNTTALQMSLKSIYIYIYIHFYTSKCDNKTKSENDKHYFLLLIITY